MSADAIIVEKNHGGKWVKEVLLGVDRYANVIEVWASDGKITRAQPIAALFEPDPDRDPRHRAVHVGFHEELEEECTSYIAGDLSPNRLDAMVWGLTHLMLGQRSARSGEYQDDRLTGRR